MLRLRFPANKYQKRLIRPIYANTQATPYAANLDASLRNASDGSVRIPLVSDAQGVTNPFATTRTASAATLKNSLIPGLVMVKTTGENVAVGTGANVVEQPLGLLANFVGGDLDDGFSGDTLLNSTGVWRGPDSVFELLAPAFSDDGKTTAGVTLTGQQTLTAAIAGAAVGAPVALYCGGDGRLGSFSTPGNRVVVAHLLDRPSATRILVDLRI